MSMVTLGVDAHKRTHTVVAVDDAGRKLGSHTVAAVPGGHLEAAKWAAQWGPRRWAIEDCRHVSRQLEKDLLAVGEVVVRVPPKLTAGARESSREPGKSDPIDALAVARAAMREPDLPHARLDGRSREVKLLLDHREDLVGERTRIQNRLRWYLHELAPEHEIGPRGLNRQHVRRSLAVLLAGGRDTLHLLAVESLGRVEELTVRIDTLEEQIESLALELAPNLLAMYGCGGLSAAKLLAETADVRRFRSRAAYARHNGTAPIPVWSGNRTRHRLNRGGNRQLNAALHRIAVAQLRREGPSRTYFQHRTALGNSKTEAYRALRRRLSDDVYRRLRLDCERLQIQPIAAA
jgi:transposase